MRFLAGFLVVLFPMLSVSQEKAWVGRIILPKRLDAKVTQFDDAGKKVRVFTLDDNLSYRVLAEKAGQVKIVTTQGETGWLDKNDGVLTGDAVKLFTEAIVADPRDAGAYQKRAYVLGLEGRFEQAIKDINQAIHLEYYDMGGWNSRGLLYTARRDYDEALRDFGVAIRLHPTHPAGYCNRGNVFLAQKNYKKAIRDYNIALSYDPRIAYLYIQRGTAAFLGKDYDQALDDFDQAAKLEPGNPHLMLSRANMLATAGAKKYRDGKEAVKLVRKALALDKAPGAETMEIVASAHAEAGDFAEAVRWQERAIEAHGPENRDAARARLVLYNAKKAYRQE